MYETAQERAERRAEALRKELPEGTTLAGLTDFQDRPLRLTPGDYLSVTYTDSATEQQSEVLHKHSITDPIAITVIYVLEVKNAMGMKNGFLVGIGESIE